MTPRDAMRCAGWALRLAAWTKLTQWGQTEADATARSGVAPVRAAWRRLSDGAGLTWTDADGAWNLVAVREWVVAGPTTFAVGDGCVWVLSAERETR